MNFPHVKKSNRIERTAQQHSHDTAREKQMQAEEKRLNDEITHNIACVQSSALGVFRKREKMKDAVA
jgi:hypothetical protein